MARVGRSSLRSGAGTASGRRASKRSKRSPVLRPWRALTPIGGPRPSFHSRSRSASSFGPSTLLATRRQGTPARRRMRAIPSSSMSTGVRASTTKRTTSAAERAASTWARTPSISPSPRTSQPPVSTMMNGTPAHSASNCLRSRVTPGRASTTAARRRRIRLTSVDFPTLGRPTTATTGSLLTFVLRR